MAEANYTPTTINHNGRNYRWVDEPESSKIVAIGQCFVARAGSDGKLIPGSRLSDDFSSVADAFRACGELQQQYPDAAVFENAHGAAGRS